MEITTIQACVDAGAPNGDRKELPPPIVIRYDWKLAAFPRAGPTKQRDETVKGIPVVRRCDGKIVTDKTRVGLFLALQAYREDYRDASVYVD